MAIYPYSNIVSLISEDLKITFHDGTEFFLAKGVASKDQEATESYDFLADGDKWKTDDSQASANMLINRLEVANGARKTKNLPAASAGKIYLVSPECAAVGRKIEGRKDLVTKAELIQTLKNPSTRFTYKVAKN